MPRRIHVVASLLNLYPSGHIRLLLSPDHGSEMQFGFGEPPANLTAFRSIYSSIYQCCYESRRGPMPEIKESTREIRASALFPLRAVSPSRPACFPPPSPRNARHALPAISHYNERDPCRSTCSATASPRMPKPDTDRPRARLAAKAAPTGAASTS